jgi:hypothetical protein
MGQKEHDMKYQWIRAAACAALVVGIVAGCDDVAVKKALSDNVHNVYIPPVENKTSEPAVDQLLTQKITQAFIVDGRLKVSNQEAADVIVKTTLQRFDRIVLIMDANQVPQEYKLQFVMDVDFIDAKTAEVKWTTRRTVDLTPQPENTPGVEGADWDSADIRSLREFTTYYGINNRNMPPEDETVAENRVVDQMADRVVRLVIEGY